MDANTYDLLVGVKHTPLISVEYFINECSELGVTKYSTFTMVELKGALLSASKILSYLPWAGCSPKTHSKILSTTYEIKPITNSPDKTFFDVRCPGIRDIIGGKKMFEFDYGVAKLRPGMSFVLKESGGESRLGTVKLVSNDLATGVLRFKCITFPHVTSITYTDCELLCEFDVGKYNSKVSQLYSLPRPGLTKSYSDSCTEWYEIHETIVDALYLLTTSILDAKLLMIANQSQNACQSGDIKSVAIGDIKIELNSTKSNTSSSRTVSNHPELSLLPDNVVSPLLHLLDLDSSTIQFCSVIS